MNHTSLTLRNWSGFSTTILLTGLMSVGYGAVDIVMIAPKGVTAVAAVGLGDVITAALTALLAFGIIDTFAGRLAVEEGRGTLGPRLATLSAGMLMLVVPTQVVALLLAWAVEPGLRLAGQDAAVVPLAGDYVWVRMISLSAAVVYAVLTEALKICGLKSRVLVLLVLGLGANAALDAVVLHTGAARLFPSPVAAVAAATTAVQIVIAVCSAVLFIRALRRRGEDLAAPDWRLARGEFASMARAAPGIGLRHFNDYIGTIAITLFLGTLGVGVLAAVTVATKIWSLYCRIPQACVSGTFVFYAYALGRAENPTSPADAADASDAADPTPARRNDPVEDLRETSRTLFRYAAVPTVVGALVVAAAAPLLVGWFSPGADLDEALTRNLLWAFLLTVPAYLVENNFGEMLTVRQRGGLLGVASSCTTYLLAVPLAAAATFWLESPFLVVASAIIPSAVLGAVFLRAVERYHRPSQGVGRATGANVPA